MTPLFFAASSPSPALLRPTLASPQRKRVNSQELMANAREIEIEHVGQVYRLKLTALGKLILTK